MTKRRTPLLTAAIAVALFLLAAAVFRPVRENGFYAVDDGLYLLTNEKVKEGLTFSGLRWAFTSVGYASNWHPAAWLSHMADVELFGLDPRGHHLTSLLLHAGVSSLLFLALRGMTGSTWRSAAVAAVHAVHPLRVESVAWIAERKDLLAALFWMAGLLAWSRYLRRPGRGRYAAVVACHLLGLLSKPMMVTFPLVLIILDWWPLGRLVCNFGKSSRGATIFKQLSQTASMEMPIQNPFPWTSLYGLAGEAPAQCTRPANGPILSLRRALLEKAPLLALSLAGALTTVWAQGSAVVPLASIPATARLGIIVRALAHYLRTALWPADLAAYYPLETDGGAAASLVSVALAAGISLAAWRLRRRAPQLAAGWSWFLIALLPVVGLVKAGWQQAADRYTYLPLTGVFVALVWSISELAGRRLRALAAGLLIAAVAALIPATREQIGWWKDSETLLRRTLAVTGANWFAHLQLGKLLASKGRSIEAERELRSALAVFPDLPEAHRGIAAIRLREGRADEAAAGFRRVIASRPDNPAVWFDLGTALAAAGRHDEAASSFQRALALEPHAVVFWWSLQGELAAAGREKEARQVLARALERFPASPELLTDAGVLAARAGDLREAEARFGQALRLRPGDENARRNLARLRSDPRWEAIGR